MQFRILPKKWCRTQWVCLPSSVSEIMMIPLEHACMAHHPGNSRFLSNWCLTLSITDGLPFSLFSLSKVRDSDWSYSEFSVWAGLILVPASSDKKRLKMYHFCFQVSYPLRNTSCGIAKYSRNSQRELILRFQHLSLTPVSCVTELMVPLAMWQSIFFHLRLQICPPPKTANQPPNSSGCKSTYLNICSSLS